MGAERELTEPVDLCDAHGRLNPAARGWSRVPLHRANLSRAWGRKKRWDYWAVTAADLYVAFVYADVDYVGTGSVWVCQPSTGLVVALDRLTPFGRGFDLPDVACTGRMIADIGGLHIEIDERDPAATRLRASCASTPHGTLDIDLAVARPAGHESTNVVIPWSSKRFQFTSKHNTRPASGTVRLGEHTFELGGDANPAYGTLDLGRGVWKYRTEWNWGAASGTNADGRVVGLQFGGQWTEGTGHTENGLCVDGRLSKLHDELEWTYSWDAPMEPWRVVDPGGRVDATLTPNYDRYSRTSLGVVSMEVHQCFGRWAGWLVTDDGERVEFDGLVGFAEEARNRW